MNDDTPDLQPLMEGITKVVDRVAKREGYNALQVCGAPGAVAGAIVGVNLPDPKSTSSCSARWGWDSKRW